MVAATTSGMATAAGLIGAVLSVVLLVVWERRASAPLFDPELFAGRGPTLVYAIAFAFGLPSFTLTIYSATYFIAAFGASEAQSGLALFALAAAYVAGAIVGGAAVRTAGAKTPLVGGLACTGVALAMLAVLTPMPAVVAAMVLGGASLGFASAPPNALLLDYVAPAQAGGATGLALMLATSGSITAPAAVSAFLHFGRGDPPGDFRAAYRSI